VEKQDEGILVAAQGHGVDDYAVGHEVEVLPEGGIVQPQRRLPLLLLRHTRQESPGRSQESEGEEDCRESCHHQGVRRVSRAGFNQGDERTEQPWRPGTGCEPRV